MQNEEGGKIPPSFLRVPQKYRRTFLPIEN